MTAQTYNKVMVKYGFQCQFCGSKNELTIDHILPRSEGGSDDIKNLRCLCKTCNNQKGNKLEMSLWEKIKYVLNISDQVQSFKAEYKSGISSLQKQLNKSETDSMSRLSKSEHRIGVNIELLKSTFQSRIDEMSARVKVLEEQAIEKLKRKTIEKKKK